MCKSSEAPNQPIRTQCLTLTNDHLLYQQIVQSQFELTGFHLCFILSTFIIVSMQMTLTCTFIVKKQIATPTTT